MRITLTF